MRVLLIGLFWLSGCASPAVRCGAHLKPINAPAVKAADVPAAADRVGEPASQEPKP